MVKRRETKSDTLTVRLAPRIRSAYDVLAEREERTVSQVAGQVLTDWIRKRHADLIPPREPPEPPASSLFDPTWGACEVPLYDVRAAAGDGNFISEETLEKHLELTRRFVADLGTVPENLLGLRVVGDSMEPELSDGDVVLVNTHLDAGVPPSEDIYVFRLGSELLIKRLRPLEDGGALAVSTNPAYPPFEISGLAADGEFQVIGRLAVRWREVG
jgi:phage repressor protein C with HTH and peptisase S24 domain